MSLDLGTLTAHLGVNTSGFTKGFEGARQSIQKWSGGVPGWMAIGSAAIVAGGLIAAAGLYKIGEAFDEVEDTIRVGTGAVGDDLDGLVASAKKVGTNVPAAWSDIGTTVADVNTRLGLTGPTLEKVSSQFLELGRIMGEDVDIQTTTGALSAFRIEGDDTSGALDYLYQVAQATGVGFNDLAGRVAAAAPITQQLGFTFEETAAMIGTMDKAGLDSQNMIGAMQRGLVNLQKPGETAEDAFHRVTGEIDTLLASGDKAAAYDIAGAVFGTRGAAQFIGALESGALNMNDLTGAAGLTGDSILAAGADTMDFAEKWQLVQNKAMAALEPLGSAVFSALGDALDFVMPGLTAVGEWMTANPEAVKIIAVIMGVLAAAFVAATIATWAMNAALYANPITWIVIAIVALIAVIVLLAMNWDAVVAWVSEVWGGFIGWISDVIDGFVGWWNDTWAAVGAWIEEVWSGFVGWIEDLWQGFIDFIIGIIVAYVSFWFAVWSGVASFFTDLWNGIVSFVTGVWEGYMNWLRSVVVGLVRWWNDTWAGVGQFFGDLWANVVDGAVAIWEGLLDFFGSIPGTILGFFTGVGKWLWNVGRDLVNGLLEGIKSLASTIGSFFLSILPDWIVGPFKAALGIASPSKLFYGFGHDTVDGYLKAVRDMRPAVASELGSLVRTPEMSITAASGATAAASAAPAATGREFHYHAAENQSLSSEEALFAALTSPRAG